MKRKFRIKVLKIPKSEWSIGVVCERQFDCYRKPDGYETYISLSLVKWIITIGYLA